jgi:hypothetical protein
VWVQRGVRPGLKTTRLPQQVGLRRLLERDLRVGHPTAADPRSSRPLWTAVARHRFGIDSASPGATAGAWLRSINPAG